MKCPDKCSGAGPSRQHELTPGLRLRLPKEVADQAQYRCSYCGCVYDRIGTVYGTYDSGVIGAG